MPGHRGRQAGLASAEPASYLTRFETAPGETRGQHMADADIPQRKIQVANSRPEDSGRGLAHLPRSLMAALF